jgi:alpha-1,6-mannosyltransferase
VVLSTPLGFANMVAGWVIGRAGGPPADPPWAYRDRPPSAPLNTTEVRQLDVVRRFGTVGALLMAVGALGAGANPVNNPVLGLRLLGLPARNYTVSLACICAGGGMLVLAWLWLGRLVSRPTAAGPTAAGRGARLRSLSRSQLDRTVAMWAAPLVIAPPLFSKDVYSYLAQSAMVARGFDPYEVGVADALGVGDPLTRSIPTLWRNTPAPYGPLFLGLGRLITAIAGENVVVSVLLHRLLALAGLALIVWALPRLARRFGADPVAALWLGAANPLVLFHLVSGIHNEALMVGLMLAGLELALGRSVLAGAAVITLAALVKVPAALALGFLGLLVARRWGDQREGDQREGDRAEDDRAEGGRWEARRGGGRWEKQLSDLARAAGLMALTAVTVTLVVSIGTGLGFGWMGALGTPNVVRIWLSPVTDIGQLGGNIGILLGLGDHTDSVVDLTRTVGLAAGGAVCLWLLWRCWQGQVDAITGLGVGLGAVVILGPVVHPWYLLWAAIPLAASAASAGYRRAAVALSVTLAVLVPPTGQDFYLRWFVLLQAVLAAAVILAVTMTQVRGKLPARSAEPASS